MVPRPPNRSFYGGQTIKFTRPGLRVRDREIINVVVLSLQELEGHLLSHFRGALRTGVSGEELREILSLTGKQSGRRGIAAKYIPLVVSLRKNS